MASSSLLNNLFINRGFFNRVKVLHLLDNDESNDKDQMKIVIDFIKNSAYYFSNVFNVTQYLNFSNPTDINTFDDSIVLTDLNPNLKLIGSFETNGTITLNSVKLNNNYDGYFFNIEVDSELKEHEIYNNYSDMSKYFSFPSELLNNIFGCFPKVTLQKSRFKLIINGNNNVFILQFLNIHGRKNNDNKQVFTVQLINESKYLSLKNTITPVESKTFINKAQFNGGTAAAVILITKLVKTKATAGGVRVFGNQLLRTTSRFINGFIRPGPVSGRVSLQSMRRIMAQKRTRVRIRTFQGALAIYEFLFENDEYKYIPLEVIDFDSEDDKFLVKMNNEYFLSDNELNSENTYTIEENQQYFPGRINNSFVSRSNILYNIKDRNGYRLSSNNKLQITGDLILEIYYVLLFTNSYDPNFVLFNVLNTNTQYIDDALRFLNEINNYTIRLYRQAINLEFVDEFDTTDIKITDDILKENIDLGETLLFYSNKLVKNISVDEYKDTIINIFSTEKIMIGLTFIINE
tara:strand:- start:415 stop:1971 length:1557 start_codon:yes stop_codon:yes gene_type:complete